MQSLGIVMKPREYQPARMFVDLDMNNVIISMPSSKSGTDFSPTLLAIRGKKMG